MSLLEDVKKSIRISNNKSDDDLQAEINAAKQRMRVAGVELSDETDDLVVAAVKAYVKGVYNYQGDGEKWLERFNDLLNVMPLAREYRGGDADGR